MQKSGNANLIDLLVIQSVFSGYDHGHGRHIHAVLEGILITDLQCADIHRYRIVILDCLQQIIGNTAGCIGEVRRLGILIQILHPLRHTAAYALGDLHLGRIFDLHLIIFFL